MPVCGRVGCRNRAGNYSISLLKRKIVDEESVITWENIYNLSGKAGNKLHTQCLHKYLQTKNKTNKKLCIGRGLEGNMPSYLQLSGWWETGSFYFCHNFLHFCIFPIFYSKHVQPLGCQNKLHIKRLEWKPFGAAYHPLFVLSGWQKRMIRLGTHGVLLWLCWGTASLGQVSNLPSFTAKRSLEPRNCQGPFLYWQCMINSRAVHYMLGTTPIFWLSWSTTEPQPCLVPLKWSWHPFQIDRACCWSHGFNGERMGLEIRETYPVNPCVPWGKSLSPGTCKGDWYVVICKDKTSMNLVLHC